MPELLLLGCSASKSEDPGYLPALLRYDGPLYRDLRSHLRSVIWPNDLEVAILSAEHGLIGGLAWIWSYDRRMSVARAGELAPILAPTIETWTTLPKNSNLHGQGIPRCTTPRFFSRLGKGSSLRGSDWNQAPTARVLPIPPRCSRARKCANTIAAAGLLISCRTGTMFSTQISISRAIVSQAPRPTGARSIAPSLCDHNASPMGFWSA